MFTRCCKVNLLVFQQCLPPFENVVAGKMVNVTPAEMTCGLRSPIKYCIQTIAIYRECEMCDDGENKHPASYLTDTQEKYDETWWQSVTMLEDVHGQDIHLTVNLGTFLALVSDHIKCICNRSKTKCHKHSINQL